MSKVLIFRLCGPMAHFRKFFTNVAAMSYSFPPRTTVMGIIAAMAGLRRDSYYDLFSPEDTRIAVVVVTPVRKITQNVKYLRTTSDDVGKIKKMFLGKIPLGMATTRVSREFVTADVNPVYSKDLCYEVYFTHKNSRFVDDLAARLKEGRLEFPVSLGSAEMLGYPEFVSYAEPIRVHAPGEPVDIASVIDLDSVAKAHLESSLKLEVARERIPFHFRPGRILDERGSIAVLCQVAAKPIGVELVRESYDFQVEDTVKTVAFWEGALP